MGKTKKPLNRDTNLSVNAPQMPVEGKTQNDMTMDMDDEISKALDKLIYDADSLPEFDTSELESIVAKWEFPEFDFDTCPLCGFYLFTHSDFKGKTPLETFQIIKTRLEVMAQKHGIVLEMKFKAPDSADLRGKKKKRGI